MSTQTLPEAESIDLTAEVCPMTFVRAKQFLERMAPGDRAEIVLGDCEQIRNVPKSIKAEGHHIEAVRHEGDRFHLTVRKAG